MGIPHDSNWSNFALADASILKEIVGDIDDEYDIAVSGVRSSGRGLGER